MGVDLASDRVSAADADLPHLLALPHLKELKLSGGGVTDEGVRRLASIAGLTRSRSWTSKSSDAGLQALARLPDLGSLSIRRSPLLTDKGLEHLRRMPKLTSLGLLEVGITDAGLERLAGLGAAPRARSPRLRPGGQSGPATPPAAKEPQSLAARRQLDRRRQLAILGRLGSLEASRSTKPR